MADRVSPERRSAIMRSVRNKHTGPEMAVRRMLHELGYRYRLHKKDLPGSPDLAFISRRKAIFVHGCFWHGHGCRWGHLPKSKLDYWGPKIEANKRRDLRKEQALHEKGWRTLVVWQCELRDPDTLLAKLTSYLD